MIDGDERESCLIFDINNFADLFNLLFCSYIKLNNWNQNPNHWSDDIKNKFNSFIKLVDNTQHFLNCISNALINSNFYKIYNEYSKNRKITGKVYKYISNKSSYLDDYFEGYVSFAIPETFNDIFDCANEIVLNGKMIDCQNNAKVLCLSNDDNNKMLWGLYANSFKGFCLEYEKEILISDLPKYVPFQTLIITGDVSYVSREKNYNDFEFFFNHYSNYRYLKKQFKKCFVKDVSWSNENEYRMLFIDLDSNEKFKTVKTQITNVYKYLNLNSKNTTFKRITKL